MNRLRDNQLDNVEVALEDLGIRCLTPTPLVQMPDVIAFEGTEDDDVRGTHSMPSPHRKAT